MVNPDLVQQLRTFVTERNWGQFHSPANLAKSISIESAELLECFQWDEEADIHRVRDELADVLTYCILMADSFGLDIDEIVLSKLDVSRSKYPIEKSYGSSTKHDRLQD